MHPQSRCGQLSSVVRSEDCTCLSNWRTSSGKFCRFSGTAVTSFCCKYFFNTKSYQTTKTYARDAAISSRALLSKISLKSFLIVAAVRGIPQIPPASLGSGFIIDAENGYVITNNHVIRDAEEVRVTLYMMIQP